MDKTHHSLWHFSIEAAPKKPSHSSHDAPPLHRRTCQHLSRRQARGSCSAKLKHTRSVDSMGLQGVVSMKLRTFLLLGHINTGARYCLYYMQAEVEIARESLIAERYNRLANALEVINSKLSAVYRFLTGALEIQFGSCCHLFSWSPLLLSFLETHLMTGTMPLQV